MGMEKIEYGKLVTEQSISAGKIISSATRSKRSYLVKDKYEAQARLLDASKLVLEHESDEVTICLIGDGKGGIKRMEVTVLLEKVNKEKNVE